MKGCGGGPGDPRALGGEWTGRKEWIVDVQGVVLLVDDEESILRLDRARLEGLG